MTAPGRMCIVGAGYAGNGLDGTSGEYDTIVWATGFRTQFPFLDESA